MRHILQLLVPIFGIGLYTALGSFHSVAQDKAPIMLVNAFPEISFSFPLGIRFPNDSTNKVYVAEFHGTIKVLDYDPSATEASTFLDLSDLIQTSPAGEFHAVEFHPDYEANGYFYVRYFVHEPRRTILSRFQRSANDAYLADPESEVILLEINVPGFQNHVGGDIAFGHDGYLYVPIGDGGTLHDNAGLAQDMTSLFGKVLRIDVDNTAPGLNYGIPADNPFIGNDRGWREEIFASGLRNPWRLTVDQENGSIWVGDVGELHWEEVNLITSGKNYGWPIVEGFECVPFGDPDCDMAEFESPVHTYPWINGASITGGYVYRGSEMPNLSGHYVFLDYVQGSIWSFDSAELNSEVQAQWLADIHPGSPTFGQNHDGELYVTNLFGGNVLRLMPGPGSTSDEVEPTVHVASDLIVFPNPIRSHATIAFTAVPGPVRLVLLDVLGRQVANLYDESTSEGEQRISLNTEGLSSGLYFIRLESGTEIRTRKLLIAR